MEIHFIANWLTEPPREIGVRGFFFHSCMKASLFLFPVETGSFCFRERSLSWQSRTPVFFLFLTHHLNGDWGCQSLQSWSIETAVKSNDIKILHNTGPPHQPRSVIPAITFSHQVPHHGCGSSHSQAGGGLAFTPRPILRCFSCWQMIFPVLVFLGLKNNDCCGCCGNESCGKRFAVSYQGLRHHNYSQVHCPLLLDISRGAEE